MIKKKIGKLKFYTANLHKFSTPTCLAEQTHVQKTAFVRYFKI